MVVMVFLKSEMEETIGFCLWAMSYYLKMKNKNNTAFLFKQINKYQEISYKRFLRQLKNKNYGQV